MTWRGKSLRKVGEGAAVVTGMVLLIAATLLQISTAHGHGTGGVPGYPQATSEHWAGYVAQGPSANSTVFARVTVPSLKCTSESAMAIWVGYGGYVASDPTVEQDGLRADCVADKNGRLSIHYWLWWELFPANKPNPGNQQLQNLSRKIQPTDKVDMYVDGPVLACDLRLRNGTCIHWTQGVYFAITVHRSSGEYVGSWNDTEAFPPSFSPKFGSSECIVEDPYNGDYSAPLPQFSPVWFQNCSAFNAGPPVIELDLKQNGQPLATPYITSFLGPTNTLFEVIEGSGVPNF